MKLIGSYTSPYVRKISVMLLEKGIPFDFVNDSPWADGTQVPHVNPLGKVPALVADDGEIWFDSPVIAAYVDTLPGGSPLLPADPAAALRVRRLEALADGVTDAAVALVLEKRREADKQDAAWVVRQREALNRGLDALEQHAAARRYLNGETLNLADIAVACALGYINFRRVAPNWCVERPTLIALVERLFQRESFARTTPP
ncbi:glutathione S-transferase [Chimaeribacter arupi]|uniref:Glutathione S-transferase n=2 Tax=Yersiniaceae TaxID=1903411 RepID=A0A2N5ELB9_9GAMM|nr:MULTISPECIES: glutathione S-transferase [Yersiniaceae]MBS0967921.1 glutathione S-transferase [Nissabacter archeti]MDV5142514.1 glutathione S-transferase [Chimaeribacter arupi]PLR37162.1 glutathione S-transferase [Chimaeribacter arupi]PLR45539.1 glutathione S-transferase [Chimaeribacter arupi]PLR47993.1 glutathione S-transferase [Chimaeribacter arupi]